MGFSSKRFTPATWQEADFNAHLKNFQVWAIANYLGCMRDVGRNDSEATRRAALRKNCELDPTRAQEAWQAVVLCKVDGVKVDPKTPDDLKLYGMTAKAMRDEGEEMTKRLYNDISDKLDRSIIDAGTKLKERVNAAIKEAAEKVKPVVIKDGTKTRKVKGVLPPEFTKMVQLANARIPILLVGPAGCGKTYLCEKLGEALDLEVSDQSCSEGMSESVFNGLLLPIGKGGEFKHVPSPFMSRYESGGVMLLDEMDAGDSNLFTYINKAIANSSYTVAQRWTAPVVKKHKDFVLVAAANTFGHGADSMYVGRNQLDAATLDRFKVGLITMDYSREVESSLAPTELCEWAWRIRESIRANKLRRVMSTRVIKDLAVMTEMHDWKQQDWEAAYFTGWSTDDRRMVA